MALLGQMTLTDGEVWLPKSREEGEISFAVQSNWLEHKSIKVSFEF